jgi:hypothetical protein
MEKSVIMITGLIKGTVMKDILILMKVILMIMGMGMMTATDIRTDMGTRTGMMGTTIMDTRTGSGS